MELGNVLRGILFLAIAIVGFSVGIFTWLYAKQIYYNNSYIESPVKIQPEIKLIIVDNKVDTLYIYRRTE